MRHSRSWLIVAGLTALALLGAGWVLFGPRQDGSSLPDVGHVAAQYGGAISAVTVVGDRAWVGAGRRLQGVDVSNPRSPQALGQSEALPEAIRSLTPAGAGVTAAVGTAGLALFDVADASAPRLISLVPTTWAVNDVAVVNNLAYLAEGAQGLRIVDIGDPAHPRDLGRADTPGEALGVAVAGDRAYVADWGTGLRVMDVADPTHPREVGWLDTPGEAADVAVMGDLAVVADRRGGLRVVDVSDPTQPREMAAVDLDGTAERVVLEGQRAYVAAQGGGLQVVDLAKPDQPQAIYALPGVSMAMDVAADRGVIYVADVGATVLPSPDSRTDLWSRMHMWGVEGQSTAAVGFAGLHVARASADGLELVGQYLSPSLIEGGAASPTAPVLYLADGHAGVVLLGVSDPVRPRLIGTLDTPGVAHDVDLAGGLAVVADGPAGLSVLDVSDPLAPTVRSRVPVPGEAMGMALTPSSDLVFVAAGLEGVSVVDLVADRAAGSLDTPGYAWDVALAGDRAYVGDRQGGVRVLDVSDPRQPVELGAALEGEGDVLDVAVDGTTLWVAAGLSGIRVLDASDPRQIRELGQLTLPDRAIGIVLDGQRAWVAAGSAGLRLLDIHDPRHPRELAAWDMPGAAERLVLRGDHVYVATEMGGLQVVAAPR